MTNGSLELVSLPLYYQVRHLPEKKKQAIVSKVYEEIVCRVPAWSNHNAPVVAKLESETTIEYRAARGKDGKVRLVAPVDSSAFALPTRNSKTGIDFFNFPLQVHPNFLEFTPLAKEGIGKIITSQRNGACVRNMGLLNQMVLVDGRLHAPCKEPGWTFKVLGGSDYNTGPLESLKVIPAPKYKDRFLSFCYNPRQELDSVHLGTDWPIPTSGTIHQEISKCLVGDHVWSGFLKSAEWVASNSQDALSSLMDDETQLRNHLLLDLSNPPQERDSRLVLSAIRMARVVHGVSSNKNAQMLTSIIESAKKLAANPAPMNLEMRLKVAGTTIPEIPTGQEINREPSI